MELEEQSGEVAAEGAEVAADEAAETGEVALEEPSGVRLSSDTMPEPHQTQTCGMPEPHQTQTWQCLPFPKPAQQWHSCLKSLSSPGRATDFRSCPAAVLSTNRVCMRTIVCCLK